MSSQCRILAYRSVQRNKVIDLFVTEIIDVIYEDHINKIIDYLRIKYSVAI